MERAGGTAGAHHGRPLPDVPARTAWVFRVDGPALVLGSAQPDGHVDRPAAAAAGVAVVRRSSGGGAVLLQAGAVVWVDLLVPRGDALWDDDVGRAGWWVGEAWAAVLADLGLDAVVHRSGLVRTPWSDRVCFAGLGPGEVTVGGRKVVGIAQRRVRDQARFQCAALLRWHPGDLLGLLALDGDERRRAGADVAGRAVGLGELAAAVGGRPPTGPEPAEVETRFLAALPD